MISGPLLRKVLLGEEKRNITNKILNKKEQTLNWPSVEFETKECFLRNEIFSNFPVQRYPEVANVKCHFKENSGRKLQSMKPQNVNSTNSCFF